MLGSGEFVMMLLRCCSLLMLWLLMLLLLLRPRGRTGARPMRASSPSLGANSIISSRRNVLCVRPRRMLVLVLNGCLVFVHLRLLRSCVWLYIVVRLLLLLLLVVPSVIFSASFLPRCRPSPAVPLLRLALHLGPSPAAGGSVCVIVSTLSPPKIFGAQDTRHMPERASLICIFPRRRAGRWSWVVVTGAGAGPAPLTGGGPKPVATSHSVAGGRRLGRAPSVPEATATATTTVRGADRRYFREGHFLVGTPSPQASPANYNLIYIAGSPGPLYLDGRDGGLRRVQRTSLPRR